jgi:hypothetical protein
VITNVGGETDTVWPRELVITNVGGETDTVWPRGVEGKIQLFFQATVNSGYYIEHVVIIKFIFSVE